MSKAFRLDESIALLERTPKVLQSWLRDLPEAWVTSNEGEGTWSVYDVVGHLIHGEQTDWMSRARRILEHGESLAFEPFDREAQFAMPHISLSDRLDQFAQERSKNVAALRALNLSPADLERRGLHPAFGSVTLGELLATWVAHDCDHLMQISRIMANRYADDVGPWRAYLGIIKPGPATASQQ